MEKGQCVGEMSSVGTSTGIDRFALKRRINKNIYKVPKSICVTWKLNSVGGSSFMNTTPNQPTHCFYQA